MFSVNIDCAWVLDTRCTSHVCNMLQVLERHRMLAKGEVDLRMNNGVKVVVVAMREVNLRLASGYSLVLDTCYYVPSIIKNIILVSCLNKLRYSFLFKNNSCSIYMNDEIIGNEILTNSLFILDVRSTIMNMDVNVKRKREEMNDSFLWHCRLGHLGEERVHKLHKGG